ncbi:MAG: amidase, partial [Pikeienuella sp.]
VLGKSNTPEMGAGGNTFNEVFGRTRTPWNTALNAGGSSGGAAAALAAGEVWLAQGSDLGGSLRTPATYCGIVGLRPTPGRVSGGGGLNAYSHLGSDGPMARNVEDCALFLDAMCGHDPVDPLTFDAPAVSFREALRRAAPPGRIAFSPDMGGLAPVEKDVRALHQAAMKRLSGLGVDVVEADPPTDGLIDAYNTLRAQAQATVAGMLPEAVTRHYKKTLRENIAAGFALTIEDVIAAERGRSALLGKVSAFFRDYDAIACPVVGIASQQAEIEYPTVVDGVELSHYMDWLKFAPFATVLGLPAVSVPIGFTANGAPMGIQFIGRPRGEVGLLAVAKAMESVTEGFGKPIDPAAG